jgi:iron complex outermembrane recepter protein
MARHSTISRLALVIGLMAVSATLSTAAAAAAGGASQGLPAGDAATADNYGTEIIVTAQKREQSINDVGMSITALSGASLTDRGLQGAADLGKIVPGFVYTNSQYSSPVYTIRGVGFYESSLAAAPAVTVYVDEIPLPYPAMTNMAGLDLERVEVLKGPQGTLFGQNSTGGAVNYVSAKPTDHPAAGIDLSYGRFNTVDINGFASGPLTDKLRVRIAARGTFGDGWQRSYTSDRRNGKVNRYQGRIILDWDASSVLRFSLNVNGWRDKSDTQAGQLVAVTPLIPSNARSQLLSYPLAPHDNRAADWTDGFTRRNDSFYQIALRSEYDLADRIKLTSITAYQHLRQDSAADFDGISYIDSDFTLDGHISSFTQELRLAGVSGRLTWVIGGNYSNDKVSDGQTAFSQISSNNPIFPGLPLFYGVPNFSTQKIETAAAFGNAEFAVTDRLTFLAGARYTDTSRRFTGCTRAGDIGIASAFELLQQSLKNGSFVPIGIGDCFTLDNQNPADLYNPTLVHAKLKENNVSWRAGVNWKPAEGLLLYGNVSKGYKAGSFPTLSAALSSQYQPVPQESVIAYELGAKAGLMNSRLNLSGAAFYYDYHGKQLRGKTNDPIFGPVDALQSIPKSRVWGLEGQIQGKLAPGLEINAGATYLNSKIIEFIGVSNTGLVSDFSGTASPIRRNIS